MKNSEKQSRAALKAELIALEREEKRLVSNSYRRDKNGTVIKRTSGKIVPKSTPRTVFEVTAIGLAKRASGKYKSRWHE